MDTKVHNIILRATGASELTKVGTIQSLWSGYGSIDRYSLSQSHLKTVIVKHVRLPEKSVHPRGWNTDLSHLRKLESYQVETEWYENWAGHCNEHCRIPQSLAVEHHDNEVNMVMEDLDNSGFPLRKTRLSDSEIHSCLHWLAHFHALFMQVKPVNLWNIGTYWHLDTRPDELDCMEDGDLKQAARLLDKTLNDCEYQTLVHGDAKLANFCFSVDGSRVAAVDFQYVGGGCGMKDVAYFIGSCLDEHECERQEIDLLDKYFRILKQALTVYQPDINPVEVESVWRPLYEVAWTDFYRFLKGWSPSHWKVHSYSERLAHKVVKHLQYG